MSLLPPSNRSTGSRRHLLELYLIRHGQSTNNALEDATARTFDPPLTQTGKQQAVLLGEFAGSAPSRDPYTNPATGFSRADDRVGLGLDYLYISPMHRTLQTAAPMAEALDIRPIVRLDIYEHGGIYLDTEGVITPYPGKSRKRITTDFPRYILDKSHTDSGWYDISKGRESYAECCARAIRVAQELRERADNKDKDAKIGMVTHGTFMDVLMKAIFGMLPSRMLYYMHYNTAITRIDYGERDRLMLRYVNRVDHLPADLIT